jgi:glucose-6-phosphate 1-epimerase
MEPLSAANSSYDSLAIPGIAQVVTGRGNLQKIHITTPQAEGEIYLHGAQITSWRPKGSEDVIFVSEDSRWEDGRAIRGGIPICFPWFRAKQNDAHAPAHGFVRTKTWRLDSLSHDQGSVTATLSTESDEHTRQLWPYDFRLVHRVTIGTKLDMEVIVTNTGNTSLRFEEALHTYHRVGDATQVRIAGLNAVSFLDNTDSNRESTQQGDVVLKKATDNAYLNTAGTLEVIDPVLRRHIRVTKSSSFSTIVWNPWATGAKALADMGGDEWQRMICVEASNILQHAIALNPGEQHTMAATMELLP